MSLDKLPNKTYPGLGLSMIDRAFKDAHAIRCSADDLPVLKQYFKKGGRIVCLYCGKKEAERWDHYYPVSKGGDTVVGNLVPACPSCDDSKQNLTLDEWAAGNGKHRPSTSRLQAIHESIKRYVKKFGYVERHFEAKMDKNTRQKYRRLTDALQAVRQVLIDDDIIAR
jgi:hypothetical protein